MKQRKEFWHRCCHHITQWMWWWREHRFVDSNAGGNPPGANPPGANPPDSEDSSLLLFGVDATAGTTIFRIQSVEMDNWDVQKSPRHHYLWPVSTQSLSTTQEPAIQPDVQVPGNGTGTFMLKSDTNRLILANTQLVLSSSSYGLRVLYQELSVSIDNEYPNRSSIPGCGSSNR